MKTVKRNNVRQSGSAPVKNIDAKRRKQRRRRRRIVHSAEYTTANMTMLDTPLCDDRSPPTLELAVLRAKQITTSRVQCTTKYEALELK